MTEPLISDPTVQERHRHRGRRWMLIFHSRHSSPSAHPSGGAWIGECSAAGQQACSSFPFLSFFFCIGDGKKQTVLLRATRLALCGRARLRLRSPQVLSEEGGGGCTDIGLLPVSCSYLNLRSASQRQVATSGSVPVEGGAGTGLGDIMNDFSTVTVVVDMNLI